MRLVVRISRYPMEVAITKINLCGDEKAYAAAYYTGFINRSASIWQSVLK
jgi:hypothetical protein